MFTHHPFDHGRLDFLSSLAGQKTIKAECGQRVAFASARANLPITCPSCRTRLAERIASARRDLVALAVPSGNSLVDASTSKLCAAIERAIADYSAALARR